MLFLATRQHFYSYFCISLNLYLTVLNKLPLTKSGTFTTESLCSQLLK